MLTPTTPNFNCNSPPFLIKIKRRANNDIHDKLEEVVHGKDSIRSNKDQLKLKKKVSADPPSKKDSTLTLKL